MLSRSAVTDPCPLTTRLESVMGRFAPTLAVATTVIDASTVVQFSTVILVKLTPMGPTVVG